MTDEERLHMITEQLLIVRDNLFRGMSKSIQKLQAKSINEVLELPNFIESPQRQWVGLTDEERKNIMVECESTGDWAWELKAAQAIEAKLKQKNTWQDGDCKHCTDGCPACDARRQSNVLP